MRRKKGKKERRRIAGSERSRVVSRPRVRRREIEKREEERENRGSSDFHSRHTRVHVSRYLPSHLRANLTATNRRPRSRKWVANRRIRIYCAIKRPSLRLPSRFRIEPNFTPKACGVIFPNIFTRPDPRRLIYFARASLSFLDSACETKCRLNLIYLAKPKQPSDDLAIGNSG